MFFCFSVTLTSNSYVFKMSEMISSKSTKMFRYLVSCPVTLEPPTPQSSDKKTLQFSLASKSGKYHRHCYKVEIKTIR